METYPMHMNLKTIIQMAILPKMLYRFNTISINIHTGFSSENFMNLWSSHENVRDVDSQQNILKKEKKTNTSWLQNLIQSYNKQGRFIIA